MIKDGEHIAFFKTYMAFIKNSIGTKQYRNLFVKKSKRSVDVLKDGNLACAIFATSVLHQFHLIDRPHATVAGAEIAMQRSGWYKILSAKPGCVLIWEKIRIDGEAHRHIGFYIGNDRAISNSSIKRVPVKHHWQFAGRPPEKRDITAMYWHDNLNE